MFDFGGFEILAIVVLAVLVLGPKELPQAMRTIAKVVRKVRGLASEFQGHVNEIVREAELDDVRKSVQEISSTSVGAQVNKLIDPEGDIGGALQNPLDDAARASKNENEMDETAAIEAPQSSPNSDPAKSSDTEVAASAEDETPRGQTQ